MTKTRKRQDEPRKPTAWAGRRPSGSRGGRYGWRVELPDGTRHEGNAPTLEDAHAEVEAAIRLLGCPAAGDA